MAQIKTFSFTNPEPEVAVNLDVGFKVSEITTIDITDGGSWQWVLGMADASALDIDAGTIITTNGFTPLEQDSVYGATISGFTNANPGVITVNDTATFGFAVGDTIRVSQVSDNGDSSILGQNGDYIIASFTPTTITVTKNTTADNDYVSGGVVTRVSDSDGFAIPTENFAIQGMTIGTTAVGDGDSTTVVIVKGENPVN